MDGRRERAPFWVSGSSFRRAGKNVLPSVEIIPFRGLMSLEGTLFVTGLSLVGGWMLKVLSDRISTWQAEKKLINSIIYHLYDLGRYADRVLTNYSMFFHLTKGERDEDIYHFLLSLNKGVDVKEVLNKIHGNLLSLAEIDPVHAMELNAFISSMEMAFEMTRLDFSDDEGSRADQENADSSERNQE